SGF
ncbi:hypothetical protein CISIN_1g0306651mg, partial [Citrus sinensis]